MKLIARFLLGLTFFILDFSYTFHFRFFSMGSSNLETSEREIFLAIWQRLGVSKWPHAWVLKSRCPYTKTPHELLFYDFYRYYKKRHRNFNPIINLSKSSLDQFKEIIGSHRLVLLIATHSGFAFATKIISEKKNVEVLHGGRTGDTLRKTFVLSGIKKEIPTIQADRYCFAKMLENREENLVYVCCIDERSRNTRRFDTINPNIFDFIVRFNLAAFFYQDTLDNKGNIDIHIAKPKCLDDSASLTAEFFTFLRNGALYKVK